MPPAAASSSSSLLQQDYNPPRKVKRLRELALKEPSQSSSEFHLSMLAPVADAQPPPPATAPRRRGRKPSGPLSKSAREQLRKTNHSVIEKRRREKINEALAALRRLVPNEKAHDAEKKDKEDKEFKLEILIRTVDYLRSVVDKMNDLERGLCQKCGGGLILPSSSDISTSFCSPQEAEIRSRSVDYEQERGLEQRKRKFSEVEDDPADEPESDFDDELFEHYGRTTNVSLQSDVSLENGNADIMGSTRLPPISSWLSGSVVSSPVLQLPSPPQSVPFAPTTMMTGALPDLTLPPPFGFPSHSSTIHSSSSSSPVSSCSPNIHPTAVHGHGTGHAISRILNPPNNALTSPTLLPSPTSPYQVPQFTTKGGDLPRSTSPLSLNAVHQEVVRSPSSQDAKGWSGDERTAASLLLNMSSRRYSSVSASDDNGRRAVLSTLTPNQHFMQAQTPSSLLGSLNGASTTRFISERRTL